MSRYRCLRLLLPLSLLLLAACTPYHYGVPEDDWKRMSQEERNEIILIYQERRMHEERRRAAEAELRARELESMHDHYPGLVHLHLSGGVYIYRGVRYHYHPHTISLRYGESRKIELVSDSRTRPHRLKLWLSYRDGKVLMGDGRKTLRSFDYHDSWRRGYRYRGIGLRGGVQTEEMEMFIGGEPYMPERVYESDGDADSASHTKSPGAQKKRQMNRSPITAEDADRAMKKGPRDEVRIDEGDAQPNAEKTHPIRSVEPDEGAVEPDSTEKRESKREKASVRNKACEEHGNSRKRPAFCDD
ncbi:MAG: hypothetical protein OEZ16_11210 [Chromatiales bacterium]|nr:hypothetical protein [Chromatiales bacterium]